MREHAKSELSRRAALAVILALVSVAFSLALAGCGNSAESSASGAGEQGAPIVETSYGKVQGENLDDLLVFRGIPYAKPPVGELRFAAPAKMDPWDDVYDATEFGPYAMHPHKRASR